MDGVVGRLLEMKSTANVDNDFDTNVCGNMEDSPEK